MKAILSLFLYATIQLIIPSCNETSDLEKKATNMDKKLNLEALLASKGETRTIIAIEDSIISRWDGDDSSDQLTVEQRNFHYVQELEKEVNNGGFSQYFFNSGGDFAHETLVALKAIGATHTCKLLQTAINQFPKHTVPKDRERRQTILSQIENEANQIWGNLDQEYYSSADDLDSLVINYVREHLEQFQR